VDVASGALDAVELICIAVVVVAGDATVVVCVIVTAAPGEELVG
jgi:hypothetical protein